MGSRLDLRGIAPRTYAMMARLSEASHEFGLEPLLVELMKVRASQINGCAFCVDMHTKDARAAGESEERLHVLVAWREAEWYSERERAALELTECMTRLPEGGVPDDVYRAGDRAVRGRGGGRPDLGRHRHQRLEPRRHHDPDGAGPLPAWRARVKLHAFHTGGEIAPWSLIDPFHPKVGETFTVPFHVFLIQHDKGNVLFDLGAHPDMAHDPRARLGAAADDFDVRLNPEDDIIPQMAKVGVKPDDIDIVVLSHLHYDHCGGIEFFPQARFLVQETELRFAHWPGVYQRSVYVKADFEHPAKLARAARHPRRVRRRHGRRATRRRATRRVTSRCSSASTTDPLVLCADAAYTAYNLENRALPGIVWSADAMVESWDLLEELGRAPRRAAHLHARPRPSHHDPDRAGPRVHLDRTGAPAPALGPREPC